MRQLLLPAFLIALATGATAALVACSGDDAEGSSDDIKVAQQGVEGAACNGEKKCKAGLVCKPKSSGPPPGAVGLPIHTNAPPPGALGMPVPHTDTCQKPSPGEEGAECRSVPDCLPGLICQVDHSSSSSSSGPPPGALGMPLMKKTCQKAESSSSSSTGGPPPGALGMPIHH